MVHRAGRMPRCSVASALPSAGLEVCFAYQSLATQNLGFIEVPETLSAVPCGSKMSCQLMASCSRRSEVGTSLYSLSLMRNVFGSVFCKELQLTVSLTDLQTYFLTDLHGLSPFTGLFR